MPERFDKKTLGFDIEAELKKRAKTAQSTFAQNQPANGKCIIDLYLIVIFIWIQYSSTCMYSQSRMIGRHISSQQNAAKFTAGQFIQSLQKQ